jgi:adenosylmethionine-8-amino-7-oxononanoate aminotransferase
MKKVCDKYGALLIFDEVMCGTGRTGTLHAWQYEGVVPDIQTIGKGLGGGYAAVAGLLISHRVVDALDKGSGAFSHGQTYQGHPIACAAALEVQRVIREEGLVDNVREMGTLMEALLRKRLQNHPHVGDIRGRGLFWGVGAAGVDQHTDMPQIEFVKDKSTKQPFEPSEGVAMGIYEKGSSSLSLLKLDVGLPTLGMEEKYSISLYPGTGTMDGKYGDHVILSPAYSVTKVEVNLIVERASTVIEEYFAGKQL